MRVTKQRFLKQNIFPKKVHNFFSSKVWSKVAKAKTNDVEIKGGKFNASFVYSNSIFIHAMVMAQFNIFQGTAGLTQERKLRLKKISLNIFFAQTKVN